MNRFRTWLRLLKNYPSAAAGLAIIILLAVLAVCVVLAIPYRQAVELWRGGEHWREFPVNARPLAADWLRREKMSRTIIVCSREAAVEEEPFPGGRYLRFPLLLDYRYDQFPSEITFFSNAVYRTSGPFVRLTWHTPDGREISLGGQRLARRDRVLISGDLSLERRFGMPPETGLFIKEQTDAGNTVLKGIYKLEVEAILFEEDAELEARLVFYGNVHGLAGTDHQRRDLMVALLWGVPVALSFGLLAALGTTFTTLIIAACGVWFNGWIDAVIQRITEVNMILPLLPILVMIGTLYSTSIWVMLAVVILMGIFSAGIKMYRAMLLPLREAPYIEAARAYGTGSSRIILHYMIPRILPVLIPGFVTLIPTFVFLEASLAILGLGDPVLPTWGKILNDAQSQSALYNGHYYWVLAPAAFLMITGMGFAMLGFAMDRVFNPRLRKI